uniref:Proteasome subunit beta n=1 Tax=Chlamydomonas leiostraca TaxID=1034604 RepID=A0A7S0WTZ6_9CHLO|mmetsp:Transcript_28760/g.73223  ORF Transcript_28760/g.73223 Transcript_28760/m.73223 type:complete len:269 (+) Transcript_28760:108-914(+)
MGSNAGGFDFALTKRNNMLELKGMAPPKAWKTGTTIAGVMFKDGVVLGADTRSTSGSTVADKNCEKIHYIAPNIYCCGAGTAADTENVTNMVAAALELHRYGTGRGSRVITALTMLKQHLFKYQGHVSAALVLGGVDINGPHLFTVYPHGSTDSLPFCTMGSGSLNAMAVFEQGYKDDMTREEAMDLVARAIRSGVYNDLGSGSNVDLCIITKGGVEYLRNHQYLMDKTYARKFPVVYPKGTAPIIKERVVTLKEVAVVEAAEAMDMS